MEEEEIDLNINEEQSRGISIINDPFKPNCITNIWISYHNSGFGNPHWSGKVTFVNGKTTGEQKTNNVRNFEQVVVEMKQILDSINNKEQ